MMYAEVRGRGPSYKSHYKVSYALFIRSFRFIEDNRGQLCTQSRLCITVW